MRTETILVLETTLDDTQPQVIGFVLERALAMGALDAYTVPAQMKKQRPGVVLTLLAREPERQPLLDLLLRETSTLGVRITAVERVIAERRLVEVQTRFGPVRVKLSGSGGEAKKATPEYEDCRAAALQSAVPLHEILQAAEAAAREAGLLAAQGAAPINAPTAPSDPSAE